VQNSDIDQYDFSSGWNLNHPPAHKKRRNTYTNDRWSPRLDAHTDTSFSVDKGEPVVRISIFEGLEGSRCCDHMGRGSVLV
jgi:hypothetical protein